jgi:hypothetical protein
MYMCLSQCLPHASDVSTTTQFILYSTFFLLADFCCFDSSLNLSASLLFPVHDYGFTCGFYSLSISPMSRCMEDSSM